jgi:hypothetical protein
MKLGVDLIPFKSAKTKQQEQTQKVCTLDKIQKIERLYLNRKHNYSALAMP